MSNFIAGLLSYRWKKPDMNDYKPIESMMAITYPCSNLCHSLMVKGARGRAYVAEWWSRVPVYISVQRLTIKSETARDMPLRGNGMYIVCWYMPCCHRVVRKQLLPTFRRLPTIYKHALTWYHCKYIWWTECLMKIVYPDINCSTRNIINEDGEGRRKCH